MPRRAVVPTPPDAPSAPPSTTPRNPTRPRRKIKFKKPKRGVVASRIAQLEKQERNLGGRPTAYSPFVAKGICRDIAAGASFKQACLVRGLEPSSVWEWRQTQPEFSEAYARARDGQTDWFSNEIIDISDEAEVDRTAIQHAALRIDTRKWVMARMAPKRYGDRQMLTDGNGDPLFRLRQLTDEQRMQEALTLIAEARKALDDAREAGLITDADYEEIEEPE